MLPSRNVTVQSRALDRLTKAFHTLLLVSHSVFITYKSNVPVTSEKIALTHYSIMVPVGCLLTSTFSLGPYKNLSKRECRQVPCQHCLLHIFTTYMHMFTTREALAYSLPARSARLAMLCFRVEPLSVLTLWNLILP